MIEMSDDSVDYEPGVLRVLQGKAETKAFYNKIAKVYDLLSEQSERAMREEGIKMLAPALGERLLEIGFGTGHVLVELAKAVGPTGKVFGIDLSENMLAHAQGLLEQENLTDRVDLTCGDAEELPYDAESMDGIFMCFTLELFDTPESLGYWPSAAGSCGRVGGSWSLPCRKKASRVGGSGLRVDPPAFSQSDGLPSDLCPPCPGSRRICHGPVHDRVMWVPVEIVRARKPDSHRTVLWRKSP